MAAAYHPDTAEEHQLIKQMVQGHLRAQLCRHHLQEMFFAAKRGQREFESSRGYCGTTLHQLDAMPLIMRYLTGHERSVERANQLFYAPRLAKIGITQTKQSLTGFVSQNRRYRRRRSLKTAP
jgi:hypothetical protein